jgi:hypothetical protein
MWWATVANHLAIVAIAVVVGYVARLGYGFNCFYQRSPFGSACDDRQAFTTFIHSALATASLLYAIWGVILLVRYLSE